MMVICRAQLNKLQVQLALAQKTEERQAQLLKIQGISQQDYDISLLQVNSLRADIGILANQHFKNSGKGAFQRKNGIEKYQSRCLCNTCICYCSYQSNRSVETSILPFLKNISIRSKPATGHLHI